MTDTNRQLVALFENRRATLGVIGLGYVGLPLAVETGLAGFKTIGFDLNEQVVAGINARRSHIKDVPTKVLEPLVAERMLRATTNPADLGQCDAISICVPTPLNKIKDPDLSYIVAAGEAVRDAMRPGQLIIL